MASRSRSKNSFQGMNLSRMRRSELDDSMARNQNRHDARLEAEVKTVNRAKNVMMKSMEADKAQFMRAGLSSGRIQNPEYYNPRYQKIVKSTTTHSSSTIPKQTPHPRSRKISVPESRSIDKKLEAKTITKTKSFESVKTSDLDGSDKISKNSDQNLSESAKIVNEDSVKLLPKDILKTSVASYLQADEVDMAASAFVNNENDDSSEGGLPLTKTMLDLKRGKRGKNIGTGSMDVLDYDDIKVYHDIHRRGPTIPSSFGREIDKRPERVWNNLSEPKYTSGSRTIRSQLQREFLSLPNQGRSAARTPDRQTKTQLSTLHTSLNKGK